MSVWATVKDRQSHSQILTVIDGNLTVNDFLDSSLTGTTLTEKLSSLKRPASIRHEGSTKKRSKEGGEGNEHEEEGR